MQSEHPKLLLRWLHGWLLI